MRESAARCGFSIVAGYPFAATFLRWVGELHARRPAADIVWRPLDHLHATIVNSTLPAGRSVASASEALAAVPVLRRRFLAHLPSVLHAQRPIAASTESVRIVNRTILLTTAGDAGVAGLRAALQRDERAIRRDRAAMAMSNEAAIGIDKFSTEFPAAGGRVQPRLHVTLGSIETTIAHEPREIAAGELPPIAIPGVKVVFYLDRRLARTLTSETLELGASPALLETRLTTFFDQVDDFARR